MSKFNANFTNREIENLLRYKKLNESLESGLPLISVRPDADILGATVGQAELLLRGVPNLNPQQRAEIIERCNWIAVKLCSLRYHRKKYEELQKNRSLEILANPKISELIQKGIKICELEMLHELEAFFNQYKSALDMLAKILCPITGLNAGTLSTYGNSGSGIIKTLTKHKKNKNHGLTVGRIDWLIEEIERAKSPWLESVIKIRDTFSHYKIDMGLSFEWDQEVGRVKVPFATMDDKTIPLNIMMNNLTESLINYCTNFIAISISCAIPLTTEIQVMSEDEKQYVSAKWQMDLSRAIWKLASNVIREHTEQDVEDAKKWAEQNIFDY